MSPDRQLTDAIKANFARKSSTQLEEIIQADDPGRWSPEAVTAAAEVLQDRMAGCAQEPSEPEEGPGPLPQPPVPYSLGFLIGFLPVFVLNGLRFGSEFTANRENPDLPVPFGPKMAWLALDTTDTESVAVAIGLQGARAATWAEGIDAASHASVFVTPPLGDWTLAAGSVLFPPGRIDAFVKPLLERLSRQFGDTQYFCTHRDVELHAWAQARRGQLVRGYGWLGQKRLTLWDEGTLTKEERSLEFYYFGERGRGVEQAEQKEGDAIPDETSVMQLASLWSIDPTTLDEQFKEPLPGLLGTVAWAGEAS
jgi:hypothetical protein